jgi:flagella basal body P-ring formation protein FlgA
MISYPGRRLLLRVTSVAIAGLLPTAIATASLAVADQLAASSWPSIDALTRLTDAPQPAVAAAPTPVAATNSAVLGNGLVFANTGADSGDAAPLLAIKQNVMVDAPVIRLGDLFDQPITGGDTPIAQAPKPGQTVSLDARFLRQLVRAYHLDLNSSQDFDHVLVARKCQIIKSDAVTAALAEAISQRTQLSPTMDIAFDTGEVQFTLPTNVAATVAVQGLNFDPTSNRFLAILAVPATGPTLYTQQVVGTIYEKTQVPVLKRLISAGETIQAEDIDWTSSRLDQLATNTVTDSQQMVGRIAKRPLRPGQTLRLSDLINEPTVHKNSLITIAVQTADMSLTVRGKALDDGAIGQSIRVVNINTNKQLVGVVKDAATVVIPTTGPLALN